MILKILKIKSACLNLSIYFAKFLQTLNQRQIVSGYAEIIKHALIADKNYWKLLMKHQLQINWEETIYHSLI